MANDPPDFTVIVPPIANALVSFSANEQQTSTKPKNLPLVGVLRLC